MNNDKLPETAAGPKCGWLQRVDGVGLTKAIAADFDPYLEAVITDIPSGDEYFDESVLGVRDLSGFLADRALKILLEFIKLERLSCMSKPESETETALYRAAWDAAIAYACQVARNVQPSSVSATGEAHMRGYRDAIIHEISKATMGPGSISDGE